MAARPKTRGTLPERHLHADPGLLTFPGGFEGVDPFGLLGDEHVGVEQLLTSSARNSAVSAADQSDTVHEVLRVGKKTLGRSPPRQSGHRPRCTFTTLAKFSESVQSAVPVRLERLILTGVSPAASGSRAGSGYEKEIERIPEA